jgi:hypothetical protein
VLILLTEAEVMAINDTVCQLCYIRKLFEPLGIDLTRAITLYNDNQSVIKIVTDPTGKTYRRALKHTDIKIKHLHEQVVQKTVVVKYCSGIIPSLAIEKFQ